MDVDELRLALFRLPPETAAKLLRELLDVMPALTPSPGRYTTTGQQVIDCYGDALKRLADGNGDSTT